MMWTRLMRALRRGGDAGVTAVEYGLIIGLVALVAIPSIVALNNAFAGSYRSTTAQDTGVCVEGQPGEDCSSLEVMVPQTDPLTPTDGGTTAQTITFPTVSPGTVGTPGTATATSDSGLPVTITSLTLSVCTVSGSVVTYVAAGTCTLAANQSGDGTYAPALQVTQDIIVTASSGPLPQTITWSPPLTGLVGQTVTLTATAPGGAVSYASVTPSKCTVVGSALTYIAIGTCTVNADQAGGSGWQAAPTVTANIAVGKGTPTITFPQPTSPKAIGSTEAMSATSPSPVTISYSVVSASPAKCSVTGSTVSFLRAGTCTIQADQAADANWNAAAPVTRDITVLSSQTITFTAPASPRVIDDTAVLSATAPGGTVTFSTANNAICSVVGANITYNGAGTCTIYADQGGDGATYGPAPQVSQTVTVNRKSQSITFTAPASPRIALDTATLSATAPGGTVTFSTADAAVCSVDASDVITYHQSGTCTIYADQGGDATYAAASRVTRTVTVNKKSQTVAFTSPPTTGRVNETGTVTGSATSGLTVAFSSGSTSVCTVTAAGDVTYLATGTCVVRANQTGNAVYSAASQVTTSITVSAGPPSEPTNLAASTPGSISSGQIKLNWNAPSSNGGSAITDYVIQYKLSSASSWTTFADGVSTTSDTVVTGLTAGASYDLRVAAKNVIGTGAFTASVTQAAKT